MDKLWGELSRKIIRIRSLLAAERIEKGGVVIATFSKDSLHMVCVCTKRIKEGERMK